MGEPVMNVVTLSAILCASVGVLAYLNTLDCGLCFDDERAVIQNRDLRPDSSWANLLWNDFWGVPMSSSDSHKSYRPLCVATFRLNYLLHELEPMGYHLVNILLHGVVCYLYVQLCGLVLSEVWPALIAGLLFAVHPIHTEAVSGVVGRADVMAGLLYIASILVYYQAAQNGNGYKWLVLSLVLCGCSALSKETGITAVALCLTLDYSFIQQLTVLDAVKLLSSSQGTKAPRGLLRRLIVLMTFAVGFMYFRLTLMKDNPAFSYALNPARYQPSPYRQLHWSYLSAFHCWLLLAPSQLVPEYALHTIPLIRSLGDVRNLATLVTFVAVGGLTTFALSGRGGGARVTLFALSLMVFPYLPASNLFFPVGFVVAERVLYLPSMGLCLLVAQGVWTLLKQSNKLVRYLTLASLTMLLITHSTKTLMRNREWKNEIALYTAALRVTPHNAKLAHNLGVEYSKSSDPSVKGQAIQLMKLSISAEPLYLSAISDLGYLYDLQDRNKEAEETYKHGLDLLHQSLDGNITISTAVKNLKLLTRYSKFLRRQTRLSESERVMLATVSKLSPHTHYPSFYAELAVVLALQGNVTGARVYVDKALRQDPQHIQSLVAMAKLYMAQGSKDKAEKVLREAIKRLGLKSPLVHELGVVLLASYHDDEVKLKEAENLLKSVLQVQPTNVDVLHSLGMVYISLKQVSLAHAALLKAVQQSSNHVGALYDLGQLYVLAGECDKARERLEQVLGVVPDHKQARPLMEGCRQRAERT